MNDLTRTVIAFAKARHLRGHGFDDETARDWARQNLDALDLCVAFAEAKAHAEELENRDESADLEAALEGLAELFVTF